jgi:predicted RNA-binding protein with PUA-like domain
MPEYYSPKMEDSKNRWESMVVKDSKESSRIFNEDLGKKIIPSIKRWDNHLI